MKLAFNLSGLKKLVLKNTFIQIVGRGGVAFFNFLTTVILTRILGRGRYGDYVFLLSFWLFLVSLADWGTQIIGVREIAKVKKERREKIIGSLFQLRWLLLGGVLLLGGILIFSLPVFRELRLLAGFSLLALLFVNWQKGAEIVFQALFRFDWQVLTEIIAAGSFFLLVLFFFLQKNLNLSTAILSLILSRFFSFLFARFQFKKLYPKTGKSSHWRQFLWKEALPVGGLLLLSTSYDRLIDTTFLKFFQGSEAVGIYGLAYKLYGNFILPAFYLSRSLFPLFSVKKKTVFHWGLKWAFLGGIAVALGGWLMAPWLVLLLGGKEFFLSATALRILLLSLPFTYLNHIFGFMMIARGYQWYSFWGELGGLVFNFFANWWLIPLFSWRAAAWVTVATEGLICLILFFLLRRKGLRC
ncbi:flippase [bacterium]|nr:flippase [bacterium]